MSKLIPAKDELQVASSKTLTGSLTPAAQRALAEADERRRLAQTSSAKQESSSPQNPAPQEPALQNPAPKEIGGRNGPEPTRYGDWEVKGIVSDF